MSQQHRTSERSPARSFADTEALVAAAQEHFATDFPNPQRAGCPAPGVIQTIVGRERLPEDELQTHLFGCSECFNEYRAAVLDHRQLAASKSISSSASLRTKMTATLWAWRRPLFAGACALLLLAAVVFTWRMRQAALQLSQVRPQPVPATPANAERIKPKVADTVSPEQAQTATNNLTPEPQTAKKADEQLLAVNVDLNDHRSLGAQRRGGGEAEPPISLPRAHLRLTLTLRENSAAGSYRVSIIDLAERARATTTARSGDGRALMVVLDLRRVTAAQAKLRIARANQPDVAPEEYNVEVTRP